MQESYHDYMMRRMREEDAKQMTWKDYEYVEADGKPIHIFDNLFTYNEREKFYSWCSGQRFTNMGQDTGRLEHKGDFNLFSQLFEEDVRNSGFWEMENTKYLLPLIEGYEQAQARVNLSTLHDKNRFHCDTYGSDDVRTILYYPNMEWHSEWGGYTLFTNQEGNKLEYCSFYIPGRVVIFDGTIPHCISAPSIGAPAYRLSFVIQYARYNNA